MVRSLAERLHAHEQQKARLAEQEAKLKGAERKARTRRLIEVGGLIDKAGLLDLEPMRSTAPCSRCATAPATRTRSPSGPHSADVPSPARPDCATKARKPSCSPSPPHWPRTSPPHCARPASASARSCSTGKVWRASMTPRASPGHMAAPRGGSLPHRPHRRRHPWLKRRNDRTRHLRSAACRTASRHPALAAVAVLVRLVARSMTRGATFF